MVSFYLVFLAATVVGQQTFTQSWFGVGVDAATLLQRGPLFKMDAYTFGNQFTDSHGTTWRYCDALSVSPVNVNDNSVKTDIYSTVDAYKYSMSTSVKVGGGIGGFVASANEEFQATLQTMRRQSTIATQASATVQMVQVTLLPGVATLHPALVAYLTNVLPNASAITFSDASTFFSIYGTMFYVTGSLGGRGMQYTYTSQQYYQKSTILDLRVQASASFLVSAEGQTEFQSNMTSEYIHNTVFAQAYFEGGTVNSQGSAQQRYVAWQNSVNSYTNLHPLPGDQGLTAWPITSALTRNFTADATLIAKGAVLSKYLIQYLSRPGCTDPLAPNYDQLANVDNGSCKNPTLTFRGGNCSACPFGVDREPSSAQDPQFPCPNPSCLLLKCHLPTTLAITSGDSTCLLQRCRHWPPVGPNGECTNADTPFTFTALCTGGRNCNCLAPSG